MNKVDLLVGKKIYSVQCSGDMLPRVEHLRDLIAKKVDSLSHKYEGITDDNLLLMTTMTIMDELDELSNHIKEQSDNENQLVEKLSTISNKLDEICGNEDKKE